MTTPLSAGMTQNQRFGWIGRPGRWRRVLALGWTSCALVALAQGLQAAGEDGFHSIFDGSSLEGWETPVTEYWSIEMGAITGRITRDRPCTINQYLVWTGGELADFELKLKSRLSGEGGINNGFQFRSRVLPDHDVCGYQMDNNLATPWLVRLYDEFGRHTLAMRGERAQFDTEGRRSATRLDGAPEAAWFRLEDWHEYHLTCLGPEITLRVDGRLAAEVEDNDPRRRELQGALALQLHSGPPTVVQFKDIRLKVLKPATKKEPAVPSQAAQRRTQLLEEAVAWWQLDSGGHGAKPPLRHEPGWDRFELNVQSAGPGARPGAKCVVLDGAHFDGGTKLPGPGDQLTVFLRARDPHGRWDAGLLGKRGGLGRAHFNLFSTDLPETPGPDIGFEMRTDRGFTRISFPVSATDAAAWHDLVGRFDGRSLTLSCDGRQMAGRPCEGRPVQNEAPLVIGAETDDDNVVRHFRGELEEAALWSRALTDGEVRALSPQP